MGSVRQAINLHEMSSFIVPEKNNILDDALKI